MGMGMGMGMLWTCGYGLFGVGSVVVALQLRLPLRYMYKDIHDLDSLASGRSPLNGRVLRVTCSTSQPTLKPTFS